MNALTRIPSTSLAEFDWRRLMRLDARLTRMEETHNSALAGSDTERFAAREAQSIRAEIYYIEGKLRARFAQAFPGISISSLAERIG